MNPRKRTITFNPGTCTGCEGCFALAPDHFEWNEDMEMPVLINDTMDEEQALELISCCPEDCIAFDEQD